MAFPDEKKLKKIREELKSIDPTRVLSDTASKAEILKYQICAKFVEYIIDNNISQAELARQLNMDPARLNEIVKYRIDLFTIDKLLDFAEKLDPEIDIKVA